jgi:hypothetical protein
MTGARLVHDTLEQEGWDVEIADAEKVKGLAPLASKTDKIDSRVLVEFPRFRGHLTGRAERRRERSSSATYSTRISARVSA